MTTIRINNAKFYAYHGVLEYEKQYGNGFEVDIEMQCDLSGLKNDELKETVDYLSVYNTVKEIFHSKKFNLIETVNNEIGKKLLEKYSLIRSVKVGIRKPNAPLGLIDNVEILNTYGRD